MISSLFLVTIAVGASASPLTERPLVDANHARLYDLAASERTRDGIAFARLVLPANGHTSALAQSRIIYLNHNGVTLTPGEDDARTNRSSLVKQTSTIPPWNVSSTVWGATVQCMKNMFARWDVVVTDQDPGMIPHIEAVFGGSPQNIGMPGNVGGVSPFTYDCGVIENSIVFTFTNVFTSTTTQTICEVMAQEIAHSYGLDHEMLASDPMTYLHFTGKRTFKDETAPCGEFVSRPCGIGGSTCRARQNSVQLLTERLGQGDSVAPMLVITEPVDGAIVAPGFAVAATASDDVAVERAELVIDDNLAGTVDGPGPYVFATDATLTDGDHVITVEATDGRNVERQSILVTVRGPDWMADGDTGGCSSGRGAGIALGLLVAFRARRRRGY